jgi:hypothetical protein
LKEGKIAIGALILLSAWLFIGLPWLIYPAERIQFHEAPKFLVSDTQAPPNGSAAAPFFVELVPATKSVEELRQEADDREEKRGADKWLVRWTAVLSIATIGLIGATAVLGYFAYRQSRDMREVIVVANRSASASERALIELERPWIFVQLSPHLLARSDDGVLIDPGEAAEIPPVAIFEIGNHGRMPAIITSCHIALEAVPATEPTAGILRDEFHMSLGPHEKSEKLHVDCPGGLMKYGVVVDLITGAIHPVPELDQLENFFFYIVIRYDDVLGQSHTTSFCWRFDLGVNYWVSFGGSEHNYLT